MAVGNEADVVLEGMLTQKQQLVKTGSIVQAAKLENKISVAPVKNECDAKQKASEVGQQARASEGDELVSNVELLATDILSGCSEVTSHTLIILS